MAAISKAVIDQRIRNRFMELLEFFAEGEEGVRRAGAGDYFEDFYDWMPHHDDGGLRPNLALSPDEMTALLAVRDLLDGACDATPSDLTAVELIDSGWSARIQQVARVALEIMQRRGRSDEELEQPLPF